MCVHANQRAESLELSLCLLDSIWPATLSSVCVSILWQSNIISRYSLLVSIFLTTLVHTHSIRCEAVWKAGEDKEAGFLSLLPPLVSFFSVCLLPSPSCLSLSVHLPLSLRGVCLYLTFLPSVSLPSSTLYISNCLFVFLFGLIQSSHSCALKWWCVMSLFPFKVSERDNTGWEGMQDEVSARKGLYISDFHPCERLFVFAVVSHPQPCNSEQNNEVQRLRKVSSYLQQKHTIYSFIFEVSS